MISRKGAKALIKKIEITPADLIEIMDARLTGYCKTINNKLYVLITHRELIAILSDCGVDVKIKGENVREPEVRIKIEVSDKELMRRVKHICGTSVDDARIDIQNEESLWLLDACLHHEVQHQNRSTMIRNLKSRIRKMEKINLSAFAPLREA